MITLIWNTVVALYCGQFVVKRHLAGDYDLWFLFNGLVLCWCATDVVRWVRRRLK